MRDPLPAPAITQRLAAPIAGRLGLTTLPLHAHEVLIGFLFYHFIQHIVSPFISLLAVPNAYKSFNKRTRINWDLHVVSMVQALFINTAALYVIFTDPERHRMHWIGRLWGYTGASGCVQGFAAGYFLWDLQVSAQYLSISGVSALLHAIGALSVTLVGFRPFANYYGLSFVLYELSTPFLNIHWFLDKLGKTGSGAQLYNGILLILSFGGCRLVWGTYQSVLIYQDIYKAVSAKAQLAGAAKCDALPGSNISQTSFGDSCELQILPTWLVVTYLAANTALSLLNFFWFKKMIDAVMKRVQPVEENKKKT